MISNESEYWAEGCQSWFDATVRCGADPQLSRLKCLGCATPVAVLELTISLVHSVRCRCQLRHLQQSASQAARPAAGLRAV